LNYLTALKWNGDKADVPMAWPADIQCIGKDILRVHATIWPIMLMHLGIATQASLLVNGFILSGGRKMSKTLGNVISVDEMLEKFGADGTRYLLLSAGPYGSDVDLTMERMTETYNADLANGLGNLVSRVLKLSESLETLPINETAERSRWNDDEYRMPSDALLSVMSLVRTANRYMDDTKPWKLVKEDEGQFKEVMNNLFGQLDTIAFELIPFMPETATKIETALTTGTVEPLFQRIA
jgi:methionyl-tRNA synthetase